MTCAVIEPSLQEIGTLGGTAYIWRDYRAAPQNMNFGSFLEKGHWL